jgi:hypothetical protein
MFIPMDKNDTPVPGRRPEIEVELERTEALTIEILEGLDQLEEKLKPVSNKSVGAVQYKGELGAPNTILASVLHERNNKLELAKLKVRNLLEQVDL